MLNLGFRTQLTAILAWCQKTSKHSIFCNHDGWSGCYFKWLLWLPAEVTLSASGTPLENIKQIAYDANFNTKVNLLKHLLQENEDMSRVLIFCKQQENLRYATVVLMKILKINLE
jgi:ATP-dependent RNA helicase RhlE